ncbi:MAG: dienelactone hydrolase, partial [Deltaproteobacteria bacterium]|nr:dienelactone hydrolase [Deltaproteobacteria bacterium]
FTVYDAQRWREIPLHIYLPAQKTPAPVVLFSHGLGGSPADYSYLGPHWAGRGYVAVFLQHHGSDSGVWENKPKLLRLWSLRRAANLKNFLLRAKDVPVVLNQLETWNTTAGHELAGRLDCTRIGMSGHSFGAITTQAVSGQGFKNGATSFTDGRIKAALPMSPSSPRSTKDPQLAFGGVQIPWLLMTGTNDVARIGTIDIESRLAVFPALPPGGKYELVLYGAEHSAFTDRELPGDSLERNPNHHRVILALSTAFWDAWLRGDASARAWLDGAGPSTVLEATDRWQRK